MITINGMSFWYHRKKPVLENIDLQIKAGGVYGVLGANGVGKTTLLHLIGGLLQPKGGDIEVAGHRPFHREASLLEQIFYVPVEFDLPRIRVSAYGKRFSPFYNKFDEQLWDNALRAFAIAPEAAIPSLSFGQKKKVLLSFALASGCPILLFDEPTDGLDIPSKDSFRRLLSSRITEDSVAIITTHHVNDVAMLLDHVVVLKETSLLLNAAISALSTQVHTVITPQMPPADKMMYSERVPGGFHCLINNNHGEEGPLDLELLFKAIQRNPAIAKNVYSHEEQI